ncbi:hypothetical protein LCGC14_0289340 [marine sediment metagenome]|uniref:Uncharacterized protein n=1 Tax=marine sediment metagenome TaxID=412755 RepID=A0A0F9UAS9_9ZZZZ
MYDYIVDPNGKGTHTTIAAALRAACLLDKDFMGGVRRGLEDYRAGRMRPWSEVKKELGLK